MTAGSMKNCKDYVFCIVVVNSSIIRRKLIQPSVQHYQSHKLTVLSGQ